MDIYISNTIDLKEGVFPNINIFQNKSQKKMQENYWIKLWS